MIGGAVSRSRVGSRWCGGVVSSVFSAWAVGFALGVVGGLVAFVARCCGPGRADARLDELTRGYSKVMWGYFWFFYFFGPSAVPWTLLYRFGIFPNHPSPAMLECHEDVYYNNQTEALERDKTCALDTQTLWGLAFLAGVASAVFTPVLFLVFNMCMCITYAFLNQYLPSICQHDMAE